MKRIRRFAVAVSMAAMLTGCTVPLNELRHSGGYPGYVLDKRMFDASGSKQLQLLRASMIVAMASRVGTAFVRDGKEADAFVDYLRNTTDEINMLAGHLAIPGNAGAAGVCSDFSRAKGECDTYSALFESDLPLLEYKMVRLVFAALPQRQAADFAASAAKGDVFSAAWQALKLASAAADGAHRGAAVYRSSEELFAQSVVSDRACLNGAVTITRVEDAADCLGWSRTKLGDSSGGLGADQLPKVVYEQAFDGLFGIMQTSCKLLPVAVDLDDQSNKLVQERLGACNKIVFEPRLRFGGLRAADRAKQAQQGTSAVQVVAGGGTSSAP